MIVADASQAAARWPADSRGLNCQLQRDNSSSAIRWRAISVSSALPEMQHVNCVGARRQIRKVLIERWFMDPRFILGEQAPDEGTQPACASPS